MAAVRVYQPRKNPMQSGRARTRCWIVEFEPCARGKNDDLMGWAGAGDTRNQLRMLFESRDDAVAFCEKQGLEYQLIEPKSRTTKLKSYSDNFNFNRQTNWTH